jgi:hypothetical protein
LISVPFLVSNNQNLLQHMTTKTFSRGNGYLDDIHISESEKSKEWYLKENIDFLIGNLLREKTHIKTYRNYYNGVRDSKEFEYITKNFGLGTPSKLKFTPLIKPRVDALVGSMLEEKIFTRVSCIDDKTIDAANEEKKVAKVAKLDSILNTFISSNINSSVEGDKDTGMKASELSSALDKTETILNSNFLSSFEVAAQDLVSYFEYDIAIDLLQKFKQLLLDLVVTGECYWRVYCDKVGSDPKLEVIKPENFFYNKNTNSQYINPTDGVVHREFMTRKQILSEYGKFMDSEQKKSLFGEDMQTRSGLELYSGRDIDRYERTDDVVRNQMSYSYIDTLEVFHCEWLAMNEVDLDPEEQEDETQADGYKTQVNKKGYRMDRYEGVKIGDVYINCGKSRHVQRSETRPYECGYSYDGVVYNDRNGKPFSIVGAMKDLQDTYDLTLFYRDNLIANSGVPGNRVNIAGIPKQLGKNFMDRLMKFIAMKKNGFELIDPTEPGAQLFSHYGDYDNSVNGNSLNAVEMVLQTMERQADLIAATNKPMLGQIAERDAVDNVKRGIKQSLLINADLFDLMRTNYRRVLTAMLNISKVCYSKGKKGSYIMGSERIVFDIIPDKIVNSDFAVNITYSSKDEAMLADLKATSKELVANQLLDPDTLIHILLSNSITEVKQLVNSAWAIKKSEVSAAGQANQTIEQLEEQIKQLTNELNKAQQQLKSGQGTDYELKERELSLKEEELQIKKDLESKKLSDQKEFQDNQIRTKQELVQLEREQLYLSGGSGSSAEPRNDV